MNRYDAMRSPRASAQVPQAEALAVDPACLTGVEDLLTLGDFNEAVPWQVGCDKSTK